MNLNLGGKVAVVTGGAKGIGAATARAFVHEGASVAVLDIDDSAAALTQELGSRTKFFRCDVSQAGQILECPVVSEEGSGFNPIQAEHDGIDKRESYLGESIALVAPGIMRSAPEFGYHGGPDRIGVLS